MQHTAHHSHPRLPPRGSLDDYHTVRLPEYTLFQLTANRKTHYPATPKKEDSSYGFTGLQTGFMEYFIFHRSAFAAMSFLCRVVYLTGVGWCSWGWGCGWRSGRVRGSRWSRGGCVRQFVVVGVKYTLPGERDVVQRNQPCGTITSLISEDNLRRKNKYILTLLLMEQH